MNITLVLCRPTFNLADVGRGFPRLVQFVLSVFHINLHYSPLSVARYKTAKCFR